MPYRSALALLTLLCGLALAGCGSSSHPAHKSAAANFIGYSECMRAHGVPNFPDPSAGGGISLSSSSGINPFSPSFKAAQSQCGKLLPGGGPGGNGHPSKQAIKQMLDISQCMRAHGVSGFPDPTTTPPSGPLAGSGMAIGHDGVFLIVPSTIDVNSPAFEQASQACHFGGGPPPK